MNITFWKEFQLKWIEVKMMFLGVRPMLLSKLAKVQQRPSEVFSRLKQAWKEEGFDFRQEDVKNRTVLYAGQVGYHMRVDLKCVVFPEDTGSVIQLIYSPLLTPSVSRPTKLSSGSWEKLREDVSDKIVAVLNRVGDWQPIESVHIKDHPDRIEDPANVKPIIKPGRGLKRLLVGVTISAIGGLMAYLNASNTWQFGSYQLWTLVAGLGVIVLCIGLWGIFWGTR
jgi:hypothetical protein